MAHKYSYPVVDRALQNFLILMFMFVVVIGGAVVLGDSGEINELPMAYFDTEFNDPDEANLLVASSTVEFEGEDVYDVRAVYDPIFEEY